MKKDSTVRTILNAITKALKTGVPVSALALGLSGCHNEPAPEQPLCPQPNNHHRSPLRSTVVGKYTSENRPELFNKEADSTTPTNTEPPAPQPPKPPKPPIPPQRTAGKPPAPPVKPNNKP